MKDLKTYYRGASGVVRAVDGVSFQMDKGESLGIVGESGCGKTTLVKSLIGVMGSSALITGGSIRFQGTELLTLREAQMDRIRWREISMITQSAMNALDPVYMVGDQITETIHNHTRMSRSKAREHAAHLFTLVGLQQKRLQDYPHQLSGGMRQRVVIAMALALDPVLIIADEPTTALDVVVQDGILKQLQTVRETLANSLILVTHDISVVAEMCHRVAVMYAGKIVEIGLAETIFNEPAHPYTMGLLNAFPTLESARGELISIPGFPPDLSRPPQGCRFAPRCPFSEERCVAAEPPKREGSQGHIAACFFAERSEEFRERSKEQATWKMTSSPAIPAGKVPRKESGEAKELLLELCQLRKWYFLRKGIFSSLFGEEDKKVHAVDGVDFDVREGEILGLAGESGSGKSTVSEVITGLQQATSGDILYRGEPAGSGDPKRRVFRRNVQMVFQDPYETLNPRFSVQQTVMEPLRNFNLGEREQRLEMVKEALQRAELSPPEQFLHRYPHELSGGQRQRVAIARAIVIEPTLLLADEPVSMLDVSIRAGILNLFRRFRREMNMSIVYVSHDLATIRYICDRTAILYLGWIAEIGPVEEVIERPRHPYTELLLSAVPLPRPGGKREKVDARGEIPDAIDLPNGCRFHARCRYALPDCGWEGRDLLNMIEERRRIVLEAGEEGREEEDRILKAIGKIRREGLDALLYLNGSGVSSDRIIAYCDKELMREGGRTIAQAVQRWEKEEGAVRVVFTPQPEPEYHPVGERHRVSCHLFRNGNTHPLSEFRSNETLHPEVEP